MRSAALKWLLATCALALIAFAGWTWTRRTPPSQHQSPQAQARRIVSLAPAITETLFALGAGDRIIGVSDFCRSPVEAQRLPRVGTALSPNFERIARLAPDLIVSELSVASERGKLDLLAPTRRLEWLSLEQITKGIRVLGGLTNTAARANSLADQMQRRLSREPPPNAARALLVLANESDSANPVWFIRNDSIHGAALRAAGARNAISDEIRGLPRISLERVIELDPDLVILLPGASANRARTARFEAEWRRVTALRAVRSNRIGMIEGQDVFSNGPGILAFVERLENEITRLSR
jgi:iron complex transport system substrate-binding protein